MKRTYIPGYNHFSHRRNISLRINICLAEKYALDDLLTVLEVTNVSNFIRTQIFHAYSHLTPEQRQQLDDLASQRADERRCEQ